MGCGKHIPSAMESAKKEDWCTCVSKSGRDVGDYPPAAGDGAAA
jgi:pyroglutamyl-peptidase